MVLRIGERLICQRNQAIDARPAEGPPSARPRTITGQADLASRGASQVIASSDKTGDDPRLRSEAVWLDQFVARQRQG